MIPGITLKVRGTVAGSKRGPYKRKKGDIDETDNKIITNIKQIK